MYYQTTYDSPIGKLLIVCNENEQLSGLWIEGQKYFKSTIISDVILKEELKAFQKTKLWLDKYFQGKCPKISELSLSPKGSAFRQRIWEILCDIPYGKVMTYGEIAQIISAEQGKKMSAQAVGGAVGHNPISIIIPCHRVIGSNGNLTGYAGGIDIKIKLLKLEGVIITDL